MNTLNAHFKLHSLLENIERIIFIILFKQKHIKHQIHLFTVSHFSLNREKCCIYDFIWRGGILELGLDGINCNYIRLHEFLMGVYKK